MLTTSRVFSFSERALRGSVDLSDVNLLCSQHVCMRPLSVVIFCTFLRSSDPLDAWMPTLIQSQKKKRTYKLKEKDTAAFYFPAEESVLTTASTKEPEER